jgi:hypothetical protein
MNASQPKQSPQNTTENPVQTTKHEKGWPYNPGSKEEMLIEISKAHTKFMYAGLVAVGLFGMVIGLIIALVAVLAFQPSPQLPPEGSWMSYPFMSHQPPPDNSWYDSFSTFKAIAPAKTEPPKGVWNSICSFFNPAEWSIVQWIFESWATFCRWMKIIICVILCTKLKNSWWEPACKFFHAVCVVFKKIGQFFSWISKKRQRRQ